MIYGLKNSLFIKQPSMQQRPFAQLDEEKRIHMEKSEFKKLPTVSSEGQTSVDGNTPGEANIRIAKVIFTTTVFDGTPYLQCNGVINILGIIALQRKLYAILGARSL